MGTTPVSNTNQSPLPGTKGASQAWTGGSKPKQEDRGPGVKGNGMSCLASDRDVFVQINKYPTSKSLGEATVRFSEDAWPKAPQTLQVDNVDYPLGPGADGNLTAQLPFNREGCWREMVMVSDSEFPVPANVHVIEPKTASKK